jgi:hypothetical protein
MNAHNPDWTEFLPSCPLKSPSVGMSKWTSWTTGGFINETFSNLGCFHPGAKSCFRSSKGYQSTKRGNGNIATQGIITNSETNSTNHCQQCCYDKNDDLIMGGPGAGTPDFVCTSDVKKHWEKDVLPWTVLGSDRYNQIWKPNQGMIKVAANMETDSGWFVTQGEEFEIETDLRTQIICDITAKREKIACNSEGSQQINNSKRLLPNKNFGALIGAVKTATGYSTPFFIGSGARIKMPASGKLVFGVNDITLQDNSGYFATSIRRVHN